MAKQNIYDNETFFEGYRKIRENEVNANKLFEIPALFSLLPDLRGRKVLDLGCGFGEHCKYFMEAACLYSLRRIRFAPVTPEATDGQGTKTERRN